MSGDRQQKQENQERRQYFRIEDSVRLSYQQVSQAELAARLAEHSQDTQNQFTVLGSLHTITQEMSGVLRKVESQTPEVARYLKALDRKIELLGRALLNHNEDLLEQPAKAVNLSASGISFDASEPLEAGSLLEIKLLLLPDYVGMLIYGEVVTSEGNSADDSGPRFCTRVNFTHLREEDQDMLIRHVLQRQSEYLRKRRDQTSSLEKD